MAVGFPTKANWAAGDILTAAQMDDLAGTVNTINPTGVTDGYVLTRNSGATYGLNWAAASAGSSYVAGKNFIINGGMDVWQRGTTFNAVAGYTADRMVCYPVAGTVNASQSSDVPTNPNFSYSISVVGATCSGPTIRQRIESINAIEFAGQTVTLSIYAKSTAGSDALKWLTQYPTVKDDYTVSTTDQSGTFSATPSGSWTRYSATFAVSANATKGYQILIYRDSTLSNTTTLYTGMQLEIASSASAFSRAGGNIQGELAACQRYYERVTSASNNDRFGSGIASSSASFNPTIYYKVEKRISPTVIDYANLTSYDGTIRAFSTLNYSEGSTSNTTLVVTVSSGLTTGRTTELIASTVGGYIGASAEL